VEETSPTEEKTAEPVAARYPHSAPTNVARFEKRMMIYPNFYQTWDVISVLLSKEIKMRYRGTVLGILWSLANPLAFTAVLYIAFRRVLQVNIENYPLFILSALFPWQWLSNSVGSAPMLFISNGALIKRLPFNKAALAVALVLNDMIHFCITIPLFAVFLFISGDHGPSLNWLVGIPLLLVTQTSLTLAIVIVIATLNALLRDLDQLVRVLLLLLFYVTPVLYSASMVPKNLEWLLLANPFSPLMISWRALMMDNDLSPYIVVAVGHACLSLLIAIPVFRRTEWKLAELV
jgi:lipopolysaccharide transport system permease protein